MIDLFFSVLVIVLGVLTLSSTPALRTSPTPRPW